VYPDLLTKKQPSPSIKPANHWFQLNSDLFFKDNERKVSEDPTKLGVIALVTLPQICLWFPADFLPFLKIFTITGFFTK
jgi:hypothetical protein